MTEHHLNTERREQWVVKFKATPEDADAGARAKMASMCDEAAGEPGHALSRRFKGRCLGRRSLEARSVVLRPEEANDLDNMLRARKDDVGPGDSGSAYVFTRDTAGDLASGWTQVTKLHADDRNQDDHFGTSVSVDGGMIVIGALFHDANGLGDSGSAYVYTLASDSTSLTRPCSCCDSKMVSRGFNKACNFELAGVPHCQI